MSNKTQDWGILPYVIAFTIACVAMVLTGHPGWATAFFIMLVLMFG